jgi:hypothetical protein
MKADGPVAPLRSDLEIHHVRGFLSDRYTSRFGRWGALLSAALLLRWFQNDIGKLFHVV